MSTMRPKKKRNRPPPLGVMIAPEARAIAGDGIAFIEGKLAGFEPLPALSMTINPGDKRVAFNVSTPNRRATIIRGIVHSETAPGSVAFARPSCVYDWEQQAWTCNDPIMALTAHQCEVLSAGCALAKTGEPEARRMAIALVQQQAPDLNVVAYATKGTVEWFTRAVRIQPGDADEAVVLHGAWALFWYLKRRKKLPAGTRRSPVAAASLALAWLGEFRFARTGEVLGLGEPSDGPADAALNVPLAE